MGAGQGSCLSLEYSVPERGPLEDVTGEKQRVRDTKSVSENWNCERSQI